MHAHSKALALKCRVVSHSPGAHQYQHQQPTNVATVVHYTPPRPETGGHLVSGEESKGVTWSGKVRKGSGQGSVMSGRKGQAIEFQTRTSNFRLGIDRKEIKGRMVATLGIVQRSRLLIGRRAAGPPLRGHFSQWSKDSPVGQSWLRRLAGIAAALSDYNSSCISETICISQTILPPPPGKVT